VQVESFQEKRTFKPIKLTLTIESADELYALWHRFNVAEADIKKCSGVHRGIPFGNDMALMVWGALDTFVKQHRGGVS